MNKKIRDWSIAGAIITAMGTVSVPFISNALEGGGNSDPVPPDPVVAQAPDGPDAELMLESDATIQPSPKPTCAKTGPNLVGWICLSPPEGPPGENFTIYGEEFPPETSFYLVNNVGASRYFTTSENGSFSEEFSTYNMVCGPYTLALYDVNGYVLTHITHATTGC